MKELKFTVGALEVDITCWPEEGEHLDAKVSVNHVEMFWISWPDREKFKADFEKLHATYAI